MLVAFLSGCFDELMVWLAERDEIPFAVAAAIAERDDVMQREIAVGRAAQTRPENEPTLVAVTFQDPTPGRAPHGHAATHSRMSSSSTNQGLVDGSAICDW